MLPSLQWFISLFVKVVPFSVTLRIWDIFLSEGHITLFRITLAIFQLYEEKFSRANDVEEWNAVIEEIRVHLDADVLIATAFPADQAKSSFTSSSTISSPISTLSSSYKSVASKLKLGKAQARQNALKVPDSLVGLGVAHCGPILERYNSTRYPPVLDISSHAWVESKVVEEIDESSEITQSAHRLSAAFFDEEGSDLSRMASLRRGLSTLKMRKKKKSNQLNQPFADALYLSDEELLEMLAIFRAVFDVHHEKFEKVMKEIKELQRQLDDSD